MTHKAQSSPLFGLAEKNLEIVDHFTEYTDGDRWTLTATSTGTATIQDELGGVLDLVTAASANDNAQLAMTKKVFKVDASIHDFAMRSLINLTEANTDDAAFFAGICDDLSDGIIANGGAALRTGGTVVGFFKPRNETRWHAVIEVAGGTVFDEDLSATNKNNPSGNDQDEPGGTQQVLDLEIRPITATRFEVDMLIDDVQVAHQKEYDFSSAPVFSPVFAVQAGGANAETLEVDLAAMVQKFRQS